MINSSSPGRSQTHTAYLTSHLGEYKALPTELFISHSQHKTYSSPRVSGSVNSSIIYPVTEMELLLFLTSSNQTISKLILSALKTIPSPDHFSHYLLNEHPGPSKHPPSFTRIPYTLLADLLVAPLASLLPTIARTVS